MASIRRQDPRPRPRLVGMLGAIGGGITGFALAAGIYLLVNPVLEGSDSGIEELQGLLWNIVPLLTLAGVALGWWIATRWRPDR